MMIPLHKPINILTGLLLILQLCMPAYGPAYFSDLRIAAEANHSGVVCTHADVDANHETSESHPHKSPCHELDAPYDIPSGVILSQRTIISTLIAIDKGILLPGYGNPLDIPPEYLL